MNPPPRARRHARDAPRPADRRPARPPAGTGTGEPPSVPLPPGPYELCLGDLRIRWPGGEIIGFRDTDLVLPHGRRVALLGRSRVGTSALAAVLLGFLDYQGTATLNGVQLRDLAGEDVRKVVGLCAHDAHLFEATVADNVRWARPDATEDEVAEALHRAGVAAGPRARVDERAFPAGGADRQRIALARALLADLPILIIDEADAPPDGDGTGPDGLLTAAEGRTVLLIIHRDVVPGAAAFLRHVDEVMALA